MPCLCDISFSLEIAERNIDRLAGDDAEDMICMYRVLRLENTSPLIGTAD